jgi:GT2 family glycosyltransferase
VFAGRGAVLTRSSDTTPGELSEHLNGHVPLAVRVIDVEQREGHLSLLPSESGEPYRTLLALLRRNGDPIGWITLPVSADGRVALDAVPGYGAPASRADGRGDRNGHQGPQPLLSVVVTTCADVQRVLGCVERLRSSAVGPFELIVVENRPQRSTVAVELRRRFHGDERISYVEEHQRGLSRARNAGLHAARGELVAFVDDDILVDEAWMGAVRSGFDDVGADCVTGLILPVELETRAQVLVERFSSFGKGFLRRTYSAEEPPEDQPLFPYTAGYFGSGANMAFRTDVARRLGGFDPARGAGTLARAGEDLDMCIRLLQAGGRLAYEPRAIVWHRHPATHSRLRAQVFGYGVGLGAMLTKQLARGPRRLALIRRFPSALGYLLDPASRKNAGKGGGFPARLDALELLGLLFGPLAYISSARQVNR